MPRSVHLVIEENACRTEAKYTVPDDLVVCGLARFNKVFEYMLI